MANLLGWGGAICNFCLGGTEKNSLNKNMKISSNWGEITDLRDLRENLTNI